MNKLYLPSRFRIRKVTLTCLIKIKNKHLNN